MNALVAAVVAAAVTAAGGYIATRRCTRAADAVLASLSEERRLREAAERNRASERAGRIAAEKTAPSVISARPRFAELSLSQRLRELQRTHATEAGASGEAYVMRPIGHVESCFGGRHGTPRQGFVSRHSRGRLRVSGGGAWDGRAACEGLADYSHVWLLFVFHENTNASATVKAKVSPPRLNGRKVGLFSTRTPHRPNALGLSLVRLERVEGNTLFLSGIDLIDGTPVLDIKPFIPSYDTAPGGDSRVAAWVAESPAEQGRAFASVDVLPSAAAAIARLVASGRLPLFDSASDFTDLVREVLAYDVRSLHQRQLRTQGASEGDGCDFGTEKGEDALYRVKIGGVTVAFRVDGLSVRVEDVS